MERHCSHFFFTAGKVKSSEHSLCEGGGGVVRGRDGGGMRVGACRVVPAGITQSVGAEMRGTSSPTHPISPVPSVLRSRAHGGWERGVGVWRRCDKQDVLPVCVCVFVGGGGCVMHDLTFVFNTLCFVPLQNTISKQSAGKEAALQSGPGAWRGYCEHELC